MIRNAMEQKYKAISQAFYLEGKNIGTIPDLIPSEAVEALYRDNVDIYMGRPRIDDYYKKSIRRSATASEELSACSLNGSDGRMSSRSS